MPHGNWGSRYAVLAVQMNPTEVDNGWIGKYLVCMRRWGLARLAQQGKLTNARTLLHSDLPTHGSCHRRNCVMGSLGADSLSEDKIVTLSTASGNM